MKQILISALALVCILGCSPVYSNGYRVGVVSKFSRKGLWVKSWEGELIMGGMRRHSDSDGNVSAVANIFEFTVTDTNVISKVEALQDSGHRCKLVYNQSFVHNGCRRDTNYTITDAIDLDREQ